MPGGPQGRAQAHRPGENGGALRPGDRAGQERDRAGRHVHTHNVAFEELALDYEFPASEDAVAAARRKAMPTFLGYPREDGRVGTRNYIAVVAASNCAAHTAELIAASFDGETLPPNVDGVVAFPHGEGCGHAIGPDTEQLAAHAGRRAGSSERLGGDHSGAGLRGEPDRSLPGTGRAAHEPAGRDDAAIERRHAGDGGGGARARSRG